MNWDLCIIHNTPILIHSIPANEIQENFANP